MTVLYHLLTKHNERLSEKTLIKTFKFGLQRKVILTETKKVKHYMMQTITSIIKQQKLVKDTYIQLTNKKEHLTMQSCIIMHTKYKSIQSQNLRQTVELNSNMTNKQRRSKAVEKLLTSIVAKCHDFFSCMVVLL